LDRDDVRTVIREVRWPLGAGGQSFAAREARRLSALREVVADARRHRVTVGAATMTPP